MEFFESTHFSTTDEDYLRKSTNAGAKLSANYAGADFKTIYGADCAADYTFAANYVGADITTMYGADCAANYAAAIGAVL